MLSQNAGKKKLSKTILNHVREGSGDGQDETLNECIESFSKHTSSTILTELAKELEEDEKHHDNYIKNFLPALLGKITQPSKLDKDKAQKIGKIISEIISGSSNKIDLRNSHISKQDNEGTSPPSDGPDPLVPSEKSPPSSPVSSRSNNQNKYGQGDDEIPNNLNIPPEEIRKKYDEVMKELMEHKRKLEPNRNEDQPQPPKQPAKEEQNTQENKNSEPTKQPNNRNFRIALATGCAFSAIGCLIAGVVTLGMVGAGLLVMSVVLTIAAAVTRYLTPPSSEVTSTDLSPLIDDGKQR